MDVSPELRAAIAARKEQLGTVKEMATRLSINPTTVGRWVGGTVKTIQEAQVPALAKELGMTEMELFALSKGVPVEKAGFVEGAPRLSGDVRAFAEWLDKQPAQVQDTFFTMARTLNWDG